MSPDSLPAVPRAAVSVPGSARRVRTPRDCAPLLKELPARGLLVGPGSALLREHLALGVSQQVPSSETLSGEVRSCKRDLLKKEGKKEGSWA